MCFYRCLCDFYKELFYPLFLFTRNKTDSEQYLCCLCLTLSLSTCLFANTCVFRVFKCLLEENKRKRTSSPSENITNYVVAWPTFLKYSNRGFQHPRMKMTFENILYKNELHRHCAGVNVRHFTTYSWRYANCSVGSCFDKAMRLSSSSGQRQGKILLASDTRVVVLVGGSGVLPTS